MSKPGSRKAQRKKIQNPVVGGAHEPTAREKRKINLAISEPRVLSTVCFAGAGLLAGLVTGLNHFPSLGALDALPRMLLLGAYLGDPHVDWLAGLSTGFAGLIIGGSLGFSALSDTKHLAMGVLLSTALTVAAVVYTGNLWLAGLAFLLGHLPVFQAYRTLKEA